MGFLLKDPANSAVQNFAELHIVSSILSDDPPYSRPVRLIQNSPLIIRPQGTFTFVTSETTELLIKRVENAKSEWAAVNHDIDNIGLRFRLLSRDGFSNTAEIVSKNWPISVL